MTLAKARANANANAKHFIIQASITIITYDHQNIFIALGTGDLLIYVCGHKSILVSV
jgi:hypothetical protein